MLLIVENEPELLIDEDLFEEKVGPLGYSLPVSRRGQFQVGELGECLSISDGAILLLRASQHGTRLLTDELLSKVTAIYCQPTNIYTTHQLGIYHQLIEAIVAGKIPNLRHFISSHYSKDKITQFKTGLSELMKRKGLSYTKLLKEKKIAPLYYSYDED